MDDHRRRFFVYVSLLDFPRGAGKKLKEVGVPKNPPLGKSWSGRVRPRLNRVWMLMGGVDVLLVARMAGNSVAMIERVYGHFRNQSYQEAQARLDRERATRGL